MSTPQQIPAQQIVALVEDEPVVRDIATIELEESGFAVVDFSTADEALPYLRQNGGHLSAVVTDVQMPGRVNGLELVDLLRSWWPHLKVLVTSGGPLVDPGNLPPTARFIAKPWRPADIVLRVREIISSNG